MLGLELAVAGQLLVAASATAEPKVDMQCPVQKSARVDVRWRSEPVKYDFTRSIAHLNHSEIDTISPYGGEAATDVGGLMSGNVRYESNIQISSVRYTLGKLTCLWVDKVMVDVSIDPVVYVASEYPQGTCRHKAILEHEHKHVALDRKIVQQYLEPIRASTAAAVQNVGVVGPKPDAQVDDYKQKMSAYIQDAVKLQIDAMFAERMQRQRGLDNKDEYDRVQAQCADEQSVTVR